MQKRLWTVIVVLLSLAIFVSSVAAAPAIENKSINLISVNYNNGTGIVLLFETTGLVKKDLKNASVFAHSNEYAMSCNFKDESSVVRCVIPGGLSKYAGESFSGTLAGFAFRGQIPEKTCSEGESQWYTVNLFVEGELVDSGEMPAEIYSYILHLFASYPEEFEGVSLQITGGFCGEDLDLEIPA